jgi:hypothetical protein
MVLTVDLASQNFQDFRPIITEYKETAEKNRRSIADEFIHREALARQVPPFPPYLTPRPFKKQ